MIANTSNADILVAISGKEKAGFHSWTSGTPTGTSGKISPRESDHGHLVQTAGV